MSLSLYAYFERQVGLFTDGFSGRELTFAPYFEGASLEMNFIVDQYVSNGDKFDPSVSWQYSIFLYKLSNALYKAGVERELLASVFTLNKSFNGVDLFYEIEMPKCFLLGHTLGSVFAKAEYGEYGVFHHGCTVGQKNHKRPNLGKGIVMYPGSMIIGSCVVRDNTVLAPGVKLVDEDTPGDCYVFDDGCGGVRFKEISEFHAGKFFKGAQ